MLKLLIVDDMRVIADGLHDLFVEESDGRLEVYKAYSAPQALSVMDGHGIDIIVSDIKMPKMSGIEMLREVKRRLPACKVIFLTSYQDFEFAREAVTLGSYDFILKTEGDKRILEAVNKAAEELLEERENRELVASAKQQFKIILPSLQRDFLLELLHGKSIGERELTEQFHALDIELRPASPVRLLVARIDRWKQSMTWSDRALLLYSARNIMDEYLGGNLRLAMVNLDASHIVGLWQPVDELEDVRESERSFRHVYGILETIQNTCRVMLKLRISMVLGSSATPWNEAAEKLQQLEFLMQNGIGLNHELLITEHELRSNRSRRQLPPAGASSSDMFLRLAKYSAMPGLLALGKKEEFLSQLEDLFVLVGDVSEHEGLVLETKHFLGYLFLGHINRKQLVSEVSEQFGALAPDPADDWTTYASRCRELALFLFECTLNDSENHSNRLIQDVQLYIAEHMHHDLSLTRLGEHVHLHPTYLSRLYKQVTGKSISDHIMEARIDRAKYLILHSNKRMNEIATEVGYQSGIAFNRFFKKIMNIAPQEYRDLLQHRSTSGRQASTHGSSE
ncbi:response regulator [Paenibacillus sp. HB172176]|uniref:response regulator n=1 Tax=Paenibacillus sp. HB172176 TaxID=2493690 RepID=UPI00143BC2D1|nr:response regulator [Paenibacillus sp. HB172176]